MKLLVRNPRSGSVALVLVVITIALITALVIEITFRSQVTASVVVNRRESAKAYELARAALHWSVFRLQLDSALDKIPAVPGTNYGGKKDDLTEVQWAFPISYPFPVGAPAEGDPPPEAAAATASDLGGSFVSVLSDESAKINLNDVGFGGPQGNAAWSGAGVVLENLLQSPRFKPHFKGRDYRELLWAIDDWIDADSDVNHLGGGVEDAEYLIPEAKYHVKNGPFYTLSELHFLKPMNDDLYRELAPFVTVYPFDARLPRFNIQPVTPQGKINVNTVPLELIAALFNRTVMPDWRERLDCAQKIVKIRSGVVFRSAQRGGTEPSFVSFLEKACRVLDDGRGTNALITEDVSKILDVASEVFEAEATGVTASTEKTIRAVIYRKDPAKPQILYWKVI